MQTITSMNSLQNYKQSDGGKKEDRKSGYVSITLAFAAGVLSALLGFLLLGIHSLTGANDRLENYGGVSLLIISFICFGVSSHFMDKAEENKRLEKKARFERFDKNHSAR